MELLGGLVDVIPWILRIFVLLFVLKMIRSFLGGPAQRSPNAGRGTPRGKAPGQQVVRQGGQLVRDPHCGTYVPMNNSVHLVSGRDTLYFCSASCRDAYRKAQSSVA
jgi:YHS domain-containing protein